MNKVDDKKVKDLIHSLGLKYRLRDEEIRKIVESQFRFTYETIRGLEIGESHEGVDELKTNFIYRHIGKLYTSKDIIRRHINKEQFLKQKKNEREEELEQGTSIGGNEDLSSGSTIQ